MGIFSRFPYTDFHRLNADWILEKVKEMLGLTQQAAEDAQEAAEDAEQAAATVQTYESRLMDLENDIAGTVRFDVEQDLTDVQRTQGRANIGAAASSQIISLGTTVAGLGTRLTAIETNAVRADTAQSFSSAQQTQARTNIDAASAASVGTAMTAIMDLNNVAVRVNSSQSFTDAQKAQARSNIGAAAVDAVISGAVLYSTSQALSTSEKNQARINIGARSQDDTGFDLIEIHSSSASGIMDVDVTVSDSVSGPVLVLDGVDGQGSGNDVKIAGVAAPTAGNDAANKAYADSIRGMNLSTISGADVVIQPDAVGAVPNTLYVCSSSALNSLEIVTGQSYAANREFTVRFTSGATATELTTPLDILGLDDLIPDANTIYEINVLGNLAVWHSWEVPTP